MSYAETCWRFLQKHGYITAWIIHVETQTTCPHDVIRQIKRKYGENILTHKDIRKTETHIVNGVEKKETKTHRIWYLNKDEGNKNGKTD